MPKFPRTPSVIIAGPIAVPSCAPALEIRVGVGDPAIEGRAEDFRVSKI